MLVLFPNRLGLPCFGSTAVYSHHFLILQRRMSVSLSPGAQPKKTNYRVRFRHGVFPDAEGQATRADIKKYDYFFAAGQRWVGTEGKCMFKPPVESLLSD